MPTCNKFKYFWFFFFSTMFFRHRCHFGTVLSWFLDSQGFNFASYLDHFIPSNISSSFCHTSATVSVLFSLIYIYVCLTMPILLRQTLSFSLSHSVCLCRAGYLPQSIPLQIICYLSEEDEFLPWHAASRALYQLDKLLDRTKDYSIFSVSEPPLALVKLHH